MASDRELFPSLSASEIEILRGYGDEVPLNKGEVLFDVGDQAVNFYAVLDGAIEISDPAADNRRVTVHEAGGFTGDSDMLSSRAAVVRGTVLEYGRAIRVLPPKLMDMIANQPEISQVLLQSFLLRRAHLLADGNYGARLIGSRYSPDTFRIREFFSRNHIPLTWIDLERDEQAAGLLETFQVAPEETPILIAGPQQIYKNPSLGAIAHCFGISDHIQDVEYDVLIVGAGPAGLAASVYAASEGLNTLTIDSVGPGGQAGTSSRIENYLGFPTGISGDELASRAYAQVQKFGGAVSIPHRAETLECGGSAYTLHLDNGSVIRGRAVVIASGAQYRKLNLPNLANFEGNGVYYGATPMEAQTCKDEEIIVIGGGNSAGQAAMFLSRTAKHVHLMIRSASLDKSMSRYLITRIEKTPNITLHSQTEIETLIGNGHLERVECRRTTGEQFVLEAQHLFSFIGARPCTEWVKGCVMLDEKGFVMTGTQLTPESLGQANWPLNRRPFMLESSRPGIFAVGDVRSESTKRVASAVGEGSVCISFVHQYLGKA